MLLAPMDRAMWFHESISQKQGFDLESRKLTHVKAKLQITSTTILKSWNLGHPEPNLILYR